jgi:hypothetical protein
MLSSRTQWCESLVYSCDMQIVAHGDSLRRVIHLTRGDKDSRTVARRSWCLGQQQLRELNEVTAVHRRTLHHTGSASCTQLVDIFPPVSAQLAAVSTKNYDQQTPGKAAIGGDGSLDAG